MGKVSRVLAASVALLATSKTNASFMPGFFASGEDSSGLIELDLKHHTPENPQLNAAAMQLMNLRAAPGDQPKVLPYIEKDLKDLFKIQIFAEILVGSDRQPFNLIFDTGSSWVWVGHEYCKSCANPAHFYSGRSSSFRQLTASLSMLNYGRGSVMGYDTTDQICLNPDSSIGNGCMEDFKFKSIVYQQDLEGLAGAGLIGLSPQTEGEGAQLFVPSLYRQKAIKRNMFSMFISQDGTSKIQIGGYDLNKYAKGPLRWYPIQSNSYWDLELGKIMLGDWELKSNAPTIMADTGTSLNMLPDDDYFKIFNHFVKGKMDCQVLPNTLHGCDCTAEQHASMPDITFELQGDVYRIPSDQWFERGSNGQCVIKFMHAPGRTMWILGLNFFIDYYTVFNYETHEIGFADSVQRGQKSKAKSFIEWAVGNQEKPQLLNLNQVNNQEEAP